MATKILGFTDEQVFKALTPQEAQEAIGGGGTAESLIVPITQEDYDNLSPPDVNKLYIIVSGPVSGGSNSWEQLTQTEYAELDPKDPDTLYIIIPE